ncbi:hypothetical protein [Arthrobacter sp. IK3]|uniref:hypothetical protein n=1 Tax=Arthrobacter sp. IK3 TaxID=3448169 RepID=UPI003EE3BC7D
MGISFQPEFKASDIERFAFTCGHPNGVTAHIFATGEEAYSELCSVVSQRGHAGSLAVCGDEYCTSGAGTMSPAPVTGEDAPALKVSGSSAYAILGAAGLPREECGSADAGEFLRAVRTAAVSSRQDSRARYVRERLPQLEAIALFAAERGRAVTWG